MPALKRKRNETRYQMALELHSAGPAGHFAPLKAHLASLAEEQDLDEGIRFKMINVFNSQYLGEIYLGAPISQPSIVVFDTGSNWLTTTSVFCDNCTTKAYDPRKSQLY